MSDQNGASCRSGPVERVERVEPGHPVRSALEPAPAGRGDDLGERLRGLVAAHLDVDPGRLVPGARLGADLCVDSLAAIELTMVIEDEFDIALPEEVVADVRTYGDVLALVAQRAGGR